MQVRRVYLPPVVKAYIKRLQESIRSYSDDEQGYSIYRKNQIYYIQKDNGSPALTTSNFKKITPLELQIITNPTHIYLLHTHPFQTYPSPSALDLQTARRFRNFYSRAKVVCVVISKKYFVLY